MLVKVSENYAGVFGLYDDRTESVHAKRAGDPPFSVPDSVAEKKIEEGVLIAIPSKRESPNLIEPAPADIAKKPRRKK